MMGHHIGSGFTAGHTFKWTGNDAVKTCFLAK